MSIINPAAVIKAVSREIFHKYGDNDIEATGDDLTFAYLLVKMISQKFRGEQYTIKPSAAAVTPPTHAITGMPPPILPGVVNALGWRAPVPNLAMPMPAVTTTGLVPTNLVAATPAAKLNRPMISEQDIQRRAFMNQVSTELRHEAYDWQEYKTPDNKLYYYHSKTKEKTWTKPDIIIKLDEEIAVIREQKSKQNKSTPPSHSQTKHHDSPSTNDPNDHNRRDSSTSSNNRANIKDRIDNNPQHDKDNMQTNNHNNNNNNEISNNNNRTDSTKTNAGDVYNSTTSSSSNSMKPVSTTAIPGTTWCVVWTDKQRVFYFNQSTKTSVWERPAELRYREDVDAIVRGDDVTSGNNKNSGAGRGKKSDSDESNTLSYSLKRMKQ